MYWPAKMNPKISISLTNTFLVDGASIFVGLKHTFLTFYPPIIFISISITLHLPLELHRLLSKVSKDNHFYQIFFQIF